MSRNPESKQLARAVRRHAVGAVAQGQKIVKARVVATEPTMTVELLRHSDVQVEADHLLLGSSARQYDARFGIKADDLVLMSRLDDGEWFVIDVLSDENFDLGDHPDEMTTTGYNTGSGQVVAEVPYYDQAGTLIGVLLLYDAVTLRDFAGHTTAAGSGAAVVAT